MNSPSKNYNAPLESVPSTKQKALRINLDENIYGTFAEIGAGQETVRQFFRVGGASGTIAKAMSAYDKSFSDDICLLCLFMIFSLSISSDLYKIRKS